MRTVSTFALAVTVGLAAWFLVGSRAASSGTTNGVATTSATNAPPVSTNGMEVATFGGGCFWCIEAVFQRFEGVVKVASGFAGGFKANPTYKEVSTGDTGHAEVIQVTYDPRKVSYEDLLDLFWEAHDPTTLNRQGADTGTQYRSVILYHTEAQKAAAEKSRREAAGKFPRPIVTEIVPLTDFYVAEDYHQDFYNNNKEYGYCQVVIQPKLEKLQKRLKKP